MQNGKNFSEKHLDLEYLKYLSDPDKQLEEYIELLKFELSKQYWEEQSKDHNLLYEII